MATLLRATCTGSCAAQALCPDRQPVGEVADVFSSSFYVKTSKDELVFVTNYPTRSPITVNLDSTSDLRQLVRPTEIVTARPNGICVGRDASIDLSGALHYNGDSGLPSLPNSQLAVTRERLHVASLILMIVDTKLSVLDELGLSHGAAKDFIRTGIITFRETGKDEQLCEAALGIVGAGSGFTPSGDDLLGGFLAAYNSLACAVGRPKLLLDSDLLEGKTSWVSAKLLDYMQRQVLDEQMRHVIHSARSSDRDEFIMAMQSLLPRGHTSGVDLMVGVILALGLLRDLAANEYETETLAKRLGLL